MLAYLAKLKRPMTHTSFPPDDRLLTALIHAEEALHELTITVH
jgi:hypothetical protein